MKVLTLVALIAGIALPFWNFPLIARIRNRKSSKDISIFWAFGVWICLILMLPAVLATEDYVFKISGLVNITIFTAVVFYVLKYR